MSPLQKSGLYYPNKFGMITIKSLEEVMGKNGLNAILNLAGLNNYIENYPPDNLDKGFDFSSVIVGVNSNFIETLALQLVENHFNKRLSMDRQQCLGEMIGQRFHPGSKTCSQHHGVHDCTFCITLSFCIMSSKKIRASVFICLNASLFA